MAIRPAILLLALFLEDDDFLCAVVFDDRRFDQGIRNHRRADLNIGLVFDHQYVLEFHFWADIAGHLLEPNGLSWRHSVPLPARSDHGVHAPLPLPTDTESV